MSDMKFRIAGRTIGSILLIEAVCMLIAMDITLIYGENPSPFLLSIGTCFLVGGPLYFFNRSALQKHSSKEGFITVGFGWIFLSAFGALPFFFNGGFGGYVDCFFEAVSGFTTTGASILTEIEALPKGILWWRSFTHFIGGMGILVLVSAISPSRKDKAHHLIRAEVPGPTSDKLVPKLSSSSKILYLMYIFLTGVQVICLLLCGMGVYDALTVSFATAGTGGFCVLNASIAGYANPAAEYVISVFMLLFSVNFSLYFLVITGKIKAVFKNEALRFFIALVSVSVICMTVNNLGRYGLEAAFRNSLFTVSSTVSTTGFVTVNHDLWSTFAKSIVIILMFCGACEGSTGGGIKASRIVIAFKAICREVSLFIHPRTLDIVKFDSKVVPERTVSGVMRFIAAYMMIIIVAILLISIDNFDFTTNFTAVLSCMSNVGPGLGEVVGPVGNFSAFSDFSKIILSACMLIGRLEIYPILILFAPSAWRRD